MEKIVALENIRSTYNVGAILRTCSFFGIKKVLLVGYSGVITLPNGKKVLHPKVEKTALGSEKDLEIVFLDSASDLIKYCEENSLEIAVVEQSKSSINLSEWKQNNPTILVFGNEVDGVSKDLIDNADSILEIKRFGKHHSLNVTTACGIVLASQFNC